MKQKYIFIIALLLCALPISAQQLTLEYNCGYATYNMNDLKNFMANPPTPVQNTKTTDNFPGYITHEGKLGIAWHRLHQAGILISYMNTVGSRGVADYSGSYRLDFRVKGIRTGLFYRFFLPETAEKIVSPYLQFSAGTIFNKGKLKEAATVGNYTESESSSLGGTNLYLEPALGCKIKLSPRIALNISASYEWDFVKKFTYDGEKANLSPNWSGFRLQGGIIYYIPL